jgi:hypothetical protein
MEKKKVKILEEAILNINESEAGLLSGEIPLCTTVILKS